jgi:hypothetical protein
MGEVEQVTGYVRLIEGGFLGLAVVVLALTVRFLFGRLEAARAEHAKALEVKDGRIVDLQRELTEEQRRVAAFAVGVMEKQTALLTEQQGTLRQVEHALVRVVDRLGQSEST